MCAKFKRIYIQVLGVVCHASHVLAVVLLGFGHANLQHIHVQPLYEMQIRTERLEVGIAAVINTKTEVTLCKVTTQV